MNAELLTGLILACSPLVAGAVYLIVKREWAVLVCSLLGLAFFAGMALIITGGEAAAR